MPYPTNDHGEVQGQKERVKRIAARDRIGLGLEGRFLMCFGSVRTEHIHVSHGPTSMVQI